MARIILDRQKDAPLQPGFQLINTEVEFLYAASTNIDIHIRGDALCSWAETYYRNRNINCQEAFSVSKELERSFPNLSKDQLSKIMFRLGDKIHCIERPLTAEKVINSIYPSSLWLSSTQRSISHLAEWLVWVFENHPSGEIQALMQSLLNQWNSTINDDILIIYQECLDNEKAEEALNNWLGIKNREHFPIAEEFPIEIPQNLIQKARENWSQRIIASHGKFFGQLELLAIPYLLKKMAAKETYQYLILNCAELVSQEITTLAKYLSYKEINELRKRLPPKQPNNIPETPELVTQWYLSEYLPYREWQESFSIPEAHQFIIKRAKQFAYWYLDNYPKALTGGPLLKWLSFYRTANLERNANLLTIIIVLDGMHSTDARSLIQNIRAHTNRLSIVNEDVAFSPIPTITQFAKEALFKGVSPDKASFFNPVGIILPEDKSPAQRLTAPDIGKIYLWRILEPDRTYHHKNHSENLLQDVAGRLEAEALKIKGIVETIPDQILLQIIITTDHGRLLGVSEKNLTIPEGMESHGRVAWGKQNFNFPAEGWFVKDEIAYIYGERFGLSDNMAIPLGEESFLGNDGRSGNEAYPHGGLFPEEVIVPWFVFARDIVRPKVDILITGEGRTRGNGILKFKALNLSDIELELENILLLYRNGAERNIDLSIKLPARHDSAFEYVLDPWPSTIEISGLKGICKVVQSNGLAFEYSANVNITSKDIYDRGENILEDLF